MTAYKFTSDDLYNKNEMMNRDGVMLLLDMHNCLVMKRWDREEAIAHTAWNYDCTKEEAAKRIDWAISVLKK